MIRVVIADGLFIIREGLKFILTKTKDLSVTGEAATRTRALEVISRQQCEVLMLDLNLPGPGGEFELLRAIREKRPRLGMLVFSMLPEKYYAVRALRSGARGYLKKDCSCEELLRAVRRVGSGGRYVSPALAEIMVQRIGCSELQPHESLSTRELEVFLSLAAGKSPTEIARNMTLSIKTISTYRARILEKMNLRTSAELVRYAILNGLMAEPVSGMSRAA